MECKIGGGVRGVAAIGLMLFLAACQTSGSDGILSSAVPDKEAAGGNSAVSSLRGDNPNDNRRLKNTQNAMTDYCPAVRIRSGTETYRVFPRGADKEDLDQLEYQATITRVARECDYQNGQLLIKIGARGRLITGPKGAPGNFEMPIRVAVQQGGCSRHFKLHRKQAQIPSGQSGTNFEFVDDTIAMPAPRSPNVRMFIGFDEGPYNNPSTAVCS